MKITKTKKDLVIKIPLEKKRWRSYGREIKEKMPNIAGMIVKEDCHSEIGFCYRIDMLYKGKEDQYTDFFIKWQEGNEEDFVKLCQELGIKVVYI